MATITIKEIANLAGVSTATVSRVLNESGGYSEETKQRVLEILRQNNYQTNVVAKSLRTKQSKTVGVIVPDITNEYYARIALAIENFFVPNGYSIFIYNTSEDSAKERLLIRDVVARGVDGLISISGTMNVLNEAKKHGLPIVCINRRETLSEEVRVIESDNFRGGFMATEELLRQGCRNIVLIRNRRDNFPMNERHRGYCEALKTYGFEIDKNLVRPIIFDVHYATECIEQLIRADVTFDGIFACADLMAIGALKALRDHQKRVPQDVKVVGFDNINFSEHSYPPLTTIEQDKETLGTKASQTLLSLMEDKELSGETTTVLPVTLIKRETTL
ncbi:LacI family DNA-binding transcriptional regulator [Desertibacillus haloalkaliphilus]|uniref:LacI family DNA-binding transcriptional regulator n=1 Tax=Desertibacillus haloalkaliphilus TaxID=1328930 RepID=UPI001C25533E|nr:LacI family DNA-binding transcriptional regulator [Desertibacillus haloalkaliphilus]MBU8906216.1 LacI family transcriptional regulator [Desertibacillus haloalkaliphilus]